MIEQIKELRVKIDGLSQLIRKLKKSSPDEIDHKKVFTIDCFMWSQEVSKSYDSLILAKSWLGKVLEELGEESLYRNDGNRKTVEDIESASDVLDGQMISDIEWNDFNHVERVDWLREKIKDISNTRGLGRRYSLRNVSNQMITDHEKNQEVRDEFNFHTSVQQFYIHVLEARFWLGFELQRIKENK